MATAEGTNNNVAIVAIIVVGALIAGAGVLFYTGAFDSKTTVIETPAVPKAASGMSLTFEDKDGTKTEIKTP